MVSTKISEVDVAADHSEWARELLREAQLRRTHQRVQVVACLIGLGGHFGAEEALAAVNALPRPPVSRATLYRLLGDLERHGILRRVQLSESHSRYEFVGDQGEHCHLVCAGCGRVEEVQSATLARAVRHLCREYGFLPEPVTVEITVASCSECQQ
jgi:Fe2+ or Zn2+ uptake regulation protein